MSSYVRSRLYRTRPDADELSIQIDAKIYIKDRELYLLTARSGRDFRSFSTGDGNSELWETRIKTYLAEILYQMSLTLQDVGVLSFTSDFTQLRPMRNRNGYRTFTIDASLYRTIQTLDRNDLPF